MPHNSNKLFPLALAVLTWCGCGTRSDTSSISTAAADTLEAATTDSAFYSQLSAMTNNVSDAVSRIRTEHLRHHVETFAYTLIAELLSPDADSEQRIDALLKEETERSDYHVSVHVDTAANTPNDAPEDVQIIYFMGHEAATEGTVIYRYDSDLGELILVDPQETEELFWRYAPSHRDTSLVLYPR